MTAQSGGDRGFTLAELLAVLALLAVLGSLSVGVFAALPARYAHEQAAASVRALLRRARAAAIEARAPTSVAIEPRRVEARVWSVLGLWRFEDAAGGLTRGARGAEGRIVKGTLDAGRLGKALYLEEPGACVDFGAAPVFSPIYGVEVELYVMPADLARLPELPPAPSGRTNERELRLFRILGKGDEYALDLREDYALVARVKGARGLTVVRETPPGVAPPERWTRVGFSFDGEELQVFAGGIRREIDPPASDPVPRRLVPSAAPLVAGGARRGEGFLGAIDELLVRGIFAEDAVEFAPDVAIDGPPAVHFDARGALDPLYHDAPVAIAVKTVLGPPRPPVALGVELSGAIR
jgi:prepilin-type N-terminal cleavage/methylation domain-containing protein